MNEFIEVSKDGQTMYGFTHYLWTREELKALLAIDITKFEDLNYTQKLLFAKAETTKLAFARSKVVCVRDSLVLEALEG